MKLSLWIAAGMGGALMALAEPGPSEPPVRPPPTAPEGRPQVGPHHVPGLPPMPRPPMPWLGFRGVKPDPATAAQVPELPPGVGFIVQRVDEDGPSDSAGLLENDIVWKMGDQLLINEGQLFTLLHHRRPGDELALSVIRGGRQLVLTVTLGERAHGRAPIPQGLVDGAVLPGESGPMRVINVFTRTAAFGNEDGRATVRRDGESYVVTIHGPDGTSIYEGTLSLDEDFDEVPREWRRRVRALQRGLDHALENQVLPAPGASRPRVIPPQDEGP